MLSISSRLFRLIRAMIPGVFIALLVIVGAMNVQMSGFSQFVPFIAVMSVFYWAIYWPPVVPKWFVFLLGLFHDGVYGTPLGSHSIILLLLWWVIIAQRRHLIHQPFVAIWTALAFSVAVLGLLHWGISCLYYGDVLTIKNTLIQVALSVVIYPILHRIFNMIHRLFAK